MDSAAFQNRNFEMSTMFFSVWARDEQDFFALPAFGPISDRRPEWQKASSLFEKMAFETTKCLLRIEDLFLPELFSR